MSRAHPGPGTSEVRPLGGKPESEGCVDSGALAVIEFLGSWTCIEADASSLGSKGGGFIIESTMLKF